MKKPYSSSYPVTRVPSVARKSDKASICQQGPEVSEKARPALRADPANSRGPGTEDALKKQTVCHTNTADILIYYHQRQAFLICYFTVESSTVELNRSSHLVVHGGIHAIYLK